MSSIVASNARVVRMGGNATQRVRATRQAVAVRMAPSKSEFTGIKLAAPAFAASARNSMTATTTAMAVSTAFPETDVTPNSSWADFDMGVSAVHWDTEPESGKIITIYYNPTASSKLNTGVPIAFNGGFNGPFMCGGEPRTMTKRERGPKDDLIFSVRLNVPRNACWLEFSFTDGTNWDEGYKMNFKLPKDIQGLDKSTLDSRLAEEMSPDGACLAAIYADPPPPEADSCIIGGSMEAAASCDLDLVVGCTDPAAPNYNPLATVDDKSCELPDYTA